jgi:hypothetical protein
MAFNRSNKKTFLSVAKLGWFLGLSLLTGCDGPQVAQPPPDATVGTKNQDEHHVLLTNQQQEAECQKHIRRFSKGLFSEIKFGDMTDFRPDVQVIRYTACAKEVQSGITRSYLFGCNFGVHHETFKGAPLQMVIYGLDRWPDREQFLGPVKTTSPDEKASQEQSFREREQRALDRSRTNEKSYGTDPCSGERFPSY